MQILVLPFRVARARVEYAVTRRSDSAVWQGIAGGAEDDETPDQAARREAWEEARVPTSATFFRLQAMDTVPVTCFRDRHLWPPELFVIPQYTFGVDIGGVDLVLSDEHTEFRWAHYQAALDLVHYDSNRTALWELDERLRSNRLPAADRGRSQGAREVG